ncbi:SsrA-binding protein SmpB [Buchnera aphidicola]|uniref:SsrA-binding protein SmpB n=1 Tax=Buchnera aphidicola TaxID=9 RepID=UPI0031B87A78
MINLKNKRNIEKFFITKNKKVYYNFFVESIIEAGLVLQGWEVRSLREKKVNIVNAYFFFKNNAVYLTGLDIQSNVIKKLNKNIHSNRNIKVLLKKKEIDFLYGKFQTRGYSLIALSLYWKGVWCKVQIAISKGKKKIDKRLYKKNKEWNIEKNRIKKII